jgi:hypothetical protein
MATYKQFLSSDVIVTPFEVNKGFTFNESEFTGPNVQIDKFKGVNADFTTNKTTTGLNSTQYQVLVYNSIKQLYYSNFLSSSTGDSLITASLLPGETPEGDVLRGPSSSTGRYYNYLQSTLVPNRPFYTASNAEIGVLSIPSRLFGDFIQPESFTMEFSGSAIQLSDDGEGNVLNGGQVVGNIIYQHGIVVLTSTDADSAGYGEAVYGSAIYGGTTNIVDDFMLATDVTCSFSSSYEIFETQYKATISEFEYNFSQNPSIISGSTDGTVYDFTTGSFFQPYVTTVGLYNGAQELLAVGKLSQPYPLSRTTDTTFYINIDR